VAEVVIPAQLAATVVAWEGDAGRRWLDRLAAIVTALADEWDLDVGPPFEPGGNISWTAPVRRRVDDREAVLKVQIPHPESAPEAAGLDAWGGEGAVRLFDHDPDRSALLIERCAPGTAVGDEPDPFAAARVGASLSARLHAVPPPAGMPTLEAVQRSWADQLEAQLLRHPAADDGLARVALEVMRARPADCTDPVLLHGDLNPTNVLASEREPWLAIDPKPMVGDPAYDGPRLVTQPDPLLHPDPAGLVAGRLDLVADAAGIDRGRLAEWCLVGAVEFGASAATRAETDVVERCAALAALIAPHLP
jgi:streptomycin 6-kinase